MLILPIDQLCSSATDASQDGGSKENPENNPDCTTVYVGNIGHEVERSATIRLDFYYCKVEIRVNLSHSFS